MVYSDDGAGRITQEVKVGVLFSFVNMKNKFNLGGSSELSQEISCIHKILYKIVHCCSFLITRSENSALHYSP